jgi:anaerobic selenocysteine-containing dehydrogenase
MIVSACGFDCYDACRIISKEDKLIGDKSHPFGNGVLCSIVNQKLLNEPRITKPMIDGKEVSWDELYHKLVTVLDDKSLLWRGSGNFGVMNQITNLLMQKVGGYTTKGTLCDGAGEAGVMEGRGVNHTLSISQIAKSEVLVVWGRNISVTNSHLMPYLEGKTIIVIDPIKTPIAKQATLHIQLKPRMDYYLAIMLSRFAFMDGCVDESWCEEFASEYEEFYEYTREHRIKAILEEMDVDLSIMGRFIDMIRDKKVVFLVGNGVQKYSIGSYVLHAIDSLAASLGLFGKEGCGVSYIGNSTAGFKNPFDVKTKQVSKVNTPFDEFDTVLIQGGNPAESMPNSNSVKAKLKR